MPFSPRMRWPFPAENQDPWYESFEDFVAAQDNSVFASMEDRNMFAMGGGTMAFNAGTGVLSWSASIELNSPVTGFRHTLAAGNIVVADLEMVYVTVARNLTNNATLTAAVSASMPNGASSETFLVLCLRRGTLLYFRNGDVLADGESRELLQADSSGGGFGDVGERIRTDIAFALKNYEDAGVTTAIGNFHFNPADPVLTGTTVTVTFVVVGYVTGAAVQGTVELYDLTNASTVNTQTFTDVNLIPTRKTASVSLPAANRMYEIRLTRTAGAGVDKIYSMWAGLQVDRTF